MNNSKKRKNSLYFGQVSERPSKHIGTSKFVHSPIKGGINKGATTIQNWEFFKGVLLHVAFTKSDEHLIEGSGVMVAPGIALCATHVLSPYMERILKGEMAINCFGISEDGIQIWKVRAATHTINTDISILALELISKPPVDSTFYLSTITTRTPLLGEELLICGFKADHDKTKVSVYGAEVSGAVWISKGNVIDTFPMGRDRAMIPWPSLALDVSSTGGMSGGPVYDKYGHLLGLLCSSIEDDVNGTSYISLIWPSLLSKFQGFWPPNLYAHEYSLLDLTDGLCKIDRPEAVSIIGSGAVDQRRYKEWN